MPMQPLNGGESWQQGEAIVVLATAAAAIIAAAVTMTMAVVMAMIAGQRSPLGILEA